MSTSGTLSNANRRLRTVVLRDPSKRTRAALGDQITDIWNRLPPVVRSFGVRLAQPRVVVVLTAFATVFAATLFYYYTRFASEIDARLNGSSLDNAVEIVTPPLRVSIGDRLPIGDLSDYLRAAGYQHRSESTDVSSIPSFEVDGNSMLVLPAEADPSQPGIGPVRIQFDKAERVASLTSLVNGGRLTSTAIEGRFLASIREGDRRKKIPVQFSEIPENLRNAIVAAEDRRFFRHSGIDWRGIARALKTDLDQGEFVQGGSTLTQQIIKNNFLTADRTVKRKLKEAAMAIILELRLSKERIFTHYCNGVYLGHSGTFAIHGFAQAAQVYFDKNLSELTLGQSAFLAGLICAPNRFSAHRDKAHAIQRRNIVLDSMVEIEAISQADAEAARVEPLQIKTHQVEDDDGASYVVDYVQRFIDGRYGPERFPSGQRVTVTMNPRLQKAAFAAVKRQTAKLDKVLAPGGRKGDLAKPVQAALVALDAHTGEVLAMVGGRSYDESQLNRATDAKR